MDFDRDLCKHITKLLRWGRRGVGAYEFQAVYDYVKQDDRFYWVTRSDLMMTLQCAVSGDHYRFGVERIESYNQSGQLRKEFMVSQLPDTVTRHTEIEGSKSQSQKRKRKST